jgi:nucleoid DNA-binding protein
LAPPLVSQAQLIDEIAEDVGVQKGLVRNFMAALEEAVVFHLGECERVKIGQLVQLEVKVKPATKKRKGRNPATGEEIMIGPKPASSVVKARVLSRAKGATPSVQKARKKLGV